MRVVITGSRGYIGRRLVRTLEGRHQVVEVPRDMMTAGPLAELFEDCDAVVHLGGANEAMFRRHPNASMAETLVMTDQVARAARTTASRLVLASTWMVYGAEPAPGAILSENTCSHPLSSYAVSRDACEHLADFLAGDLVVLRLTNVIGAPELGVNRWTLLTHDLVKQALTDGRMVMRTPGVVWRDFIDLQQTCDSIALACDHEIVPPGTYNLSRGWCWTVRDMARLVAEHVAMVTGEDIELEIPQPELEPTTQYRISPALARRYGMNFNRDTGETIHELVRFCVDHKEQLWPRSTTS